MAALDSGLDLLVVVVCDEAPGGCLLLHQGVEFGGGVERNELRGVGLVIDERVFAQFRFRKGSLVASITRNQSGYTSS